MKRERPQPRQSSSTGSHTVCPLTSPLQLTAGVRAACSSRRLASGSLPDVKATAATAALVQDPLGLTRKPGLASILEDGHRESDVTGSGLFSVMVPSDKGGC